MEGGKREAGSPHTPHSAQSKGGSNLKLLELLAELFLRQPVRASSPSSRLLHAPAPAPRLKIHAGPSLSPDSDQARPSPQSGYRLRRRVGEHGVHGAASLVRRGLLRSSSGHLTPHARVLSSGGTASAARGGVPAEWADAVPGISRAGPGSPSMLLPAGNLLLTAERSFTWGGWRETEKNPPGKWTGLAPGPGSAALGPSDLLRVASLSSVF
nr:uncharacterized protein LOC129492687 [Symphalangus syndactylus]